MLRAIWRCPSLRNDYGRWHQAGHNRALGREEFDPQAHAAGPNEAGIDALALVVLETGPLKAQLKLWLEQEGKLLKARRRSAWRIYEELQELGYDGVCDSVQRFVRRWRFGRPKHHGCVCPACAQRRR